ncbi:trace amine-associated receptor 4 [Nematostella vectensis]|uniref:trace amine-associated receptor 4 n=1 Tax=Nematostella vectensis TaxID=45351 RepID=UPI00138FFE50|nr:trace amine-associated receptor 4 [Nematostella vectensis]
MNQSVSPGGAYEAPLYDRVALVFVCSISSLVGAFTNALIVIAVLSSLHLWESRYFLLLSLSVSDFLSCALWQPTLIHSTVTGQYGSLSSFLAYFTALSSLNSLVFVTVERFIAVFFPYVYINNIPKSCEVVICAVLAYIISLGLTVLRVIHVIGVVTIYCYLMVISILLLCIYIAIFITARKQDLKVRPPPLPRQCSTREQRRSWNKQQKLHESKTTKTVAIILGVYYTCWLPFLMFPAIPVEYIPRTFHWINCAASLQSLANPFIYFLFVRRLRKKVVKILTQKFRNF